MKGGEQVPAGAKPAPTSAGPPADKLGAVQTQPQFESLSARPPAAGLSSPFATPVEGGGVFSSSPLFLDGEGGGDNARIGADDETAWLERDKEQREQRERVRREEEER